MIVYQHVKFEISITSSIDKKEWQIFISLNKLDSLVDIHI